MTNKGKILRHVAPVENLKSIVSDGGLDAKYSIRTHSRDYGYVSLEHYTGSNFMEMLGKRKSPSKTVFLLYFDKEKMDGDGVRFYDGKNFPNKQENIVYVDDGTITKLEYEQIGEYFFVESFVDLKYLTDECKAELIKWAQHNGVDYSNIT